MELTAKHSDFTRQARVDRIGIIASVLCAIHCALTPILLILLPTFGKTWAHPSTHWAMAIVVIPIAVYMMKKGYQKHGKKWIVAIGSLGILFVIVGAILPYVEIPPTSNQATIAPATTASCCASGTCQATAAATPVCTDNCCPSITVNELGEKSLHIPPASIVTTLGGLCLIAVHAGNLCSCSSCRCRKKRKLKPAPAV
ncbi:MAG: MerC domain-containing protein [Akkermansiaceae bacterium]